MIFKEYSMIFPLKSIWKNLTKNNTVNIYQTYEFNELFFKYRITSLSNIRNRNTCCRFVVCFDEGEAKCIAPLAIDKKPERTIRLLGHGTNAGYLDYVYEDPKYARDVHSYIEDKYKDCSFDYIFVEGESPLVDMMDVTETFNNYAIRIRGYDNYFTSLSKNTRQNIRTAYNRMNTDGKEFEMLKFDSYKDLGDTYLEKINDLYHKRKADWLELDKINKKTKRKVLKRDVVYEGVRKLNNPIVAILKINSEIAAFFIGFSYEHGVCIPRLAINTDFGRYSPGMILINEYLKLIPTENEYVFDLCRGDEKYKSSLGGERTTTYRLIKKQVDCYE